MPAKKKTKAKESDSVYSPKRKIEGGKVLAKVKKAKKFKVVNG